MFNVVGTCAYGYTPDPEQIKEELVKRQQKWKDEGKTAEEITFESSNWKLLEGLRYIKKNSFDFILQTVGVFDNDILLQKACDILIQKFELLDNLLNKDDLLINPSVTTMDNCYDITLVNEDYTIGNILNSELYKIFYTDLKTINYVGFKKIHPHDTDSILRISLINKSQGISSIEAMLISVIEEAIKTIKGVKGCFDGTRKEC
jgi:DNA-directed RNA polymerase subunit L